MHGQDGRKGMSIARLVSSKYSYLECILTTFVCLKKERESISIAVLIMGLLFSFTLYGNQKKNLIIIWDLHFMKITVKISIIFRRLEIVSSVFTSQNFVSAQKFFTRFSVLCKLQQASTDYIC